MPVGLDERWYVLGYPGSGKTRFSKHLAQRLQQLYPWAHLYLLDSKGDREFARWPGLITTESAPPVLKLLGDGRGGTQVWSPPADNMREYGKWLAGILKARQPAIAVIDEVSSLGGNSGQSFPVDLSRLLKQGRGLDIAAIVEGQEAAYQPRQLAAMANHFIYFGLGASDKHGQEFAASLLGFDSPRQPRHRYGYFYRRLLPRPGPVHEYGSYRELLG